MSAVAGLLSASGIGTYGGTGAQDLVGEFQETIFVRNAKGLNVGSTLFGLMSKLKTEPADNIEYSWFERNPVRRVVYTDSSSTLTNVATTLAFCNGTNGVSVNALLQNGMVLRNARTGEFIRINNGTDPNPSILTVTVDRDFVGTGSGSMAGVGSVGGTGAVLVAGDEWTIVTLGRDEGSDPIRGSYENPDSLINFIQTFNSTVWLTNAFKGQVLRTDIEGPLTDRRIQALERIARDIEFAYLLGRKKCLQGTNGYVYYTGGIYDSLINAGLASSNILDGSGATSWAGSSTNSDPQGLSSGSNKLTLATFNQWLENFMTYGSDVKLAFCGPLAYSAISTFANSQANGYRIMQGETVFGMHITTINTPFGELSLAFHPLLKEAPALNSWMFCVDLPLLVQKTFEPLFLEPDIQTPGQDTYKEQYRAKLGLKLKFANAFAVAHDLNVISAS